MDELIELTTNDELEKLSSDTKVELTLYVSKIYDTIKTTTGKLLFKFLLSNEAGTSVQVCAWNDDISRAEKVVKLNNILHLENLNYNNNKNGAKFNGGNFHAVLNLNKFSVIEFLDVIDFNKYQIAPHPLKEEDFQLVELHLLGDTLLPAFFKTTGYLKTDVHVLKSENKALVKGFFAITDGEFKLDVTIHNFTDFTIEKGSKLVLIGSAEFHQSNQVYLRVEGINAVRVLDAPKQSLNWLLKGKKLILSKTYGDNPQKKQKIQ